MTSLTYVAIGIGVVAVAYVVVVTVTIYGLMYCDDREPVSRQERRRNERASEKARVDG